MSTSSSGYLITPEIAKCDFKAGFWTVKGYLYLLMRITCSEDRTFQVGNVEVFCQEYGISVSAYYKAIADLKADGVIAADTTEFIKLIP